MSVAYNVIELTRCTGHSYCKESHEIDEYLKNKQMFLSFAFNQQVY